MSGSFEFVKCDEFVKSYSYVMPDLIGHPETIVKIE
jgi:hypothetical protein